MEAGSNLTEAEEVPIQLAAPLGFALGAQDRKELKKLQERSDGREDLEGTRKYAAAALVRQGEDAAPAVAGFGAALEYAKEKVRIDASLALLNRGRAAADDRSWQVRAHATATPGPIGDTEHKVVKALVKTLADEECGVRILAASSLKTLGPSTAAKTSLQKTLKDDHEGDRAAAARALGALGPKVYSALSPLRRLAEKDLSEMVRADDAEAVGLIEAE
jgi:HEAT repeat protein